MTWTAAADPTVVPPKTLGLSRNFVVVCWFIVWIERRNVIVIDI